jgi:acetyltransferase-like isoleucine patch superfamily enzyme
MDNLRIADNNKKDNFIIIDEKIKFKNSTINIKGKNNIIKINSSIHIITNLIINLFGDNNTIVISETNKKISNLHIYSLRGGNTNLFIDKNFGCSGIDIKMNDGYENVFIGEDCLFSHGISIRTSDGHSIVDLNTGHAINVPLDVYIGSHVWIGEDVRILKGTYIPNNSVIGGYSVVTKKFADTDENSIIAGIPAKIVKKNINWDRRRPDEINSNMRVLPLQGTIQVIKNQVNLVIDLKEITFKWMTIANLEGISLELDTFIELNAYFLNMEDTNQFDFQLLLQGEMINQYLWTNIDFKTGSQVIKFASLSNVGGFNIKDTKHIEVRSKRRNI